MTLNEALEKLFALASEKFKTAQVRLDRSKVAPDDRGYVIAYWPQPGNLDKAPEGFDKGLHGGMWLTVRELERAPTADFLINSKIADACANMRAKGFDWETGAWA